PLTGFQSNGPGLQYNVSWRQKDVEKDWTSVTVANVSKFVVSGTPTFVPYELMVRALNDFGSAPEPRVVIGYSGEDLPTAAPDGVQVLVQSSTLAEVRWEPIPLRTVRGRLNGYNVYYWKERSLHGHHTKHHKEQRVLTFSGNRTHGKLPGLEPFSRYALNVRVVNGKGEGPASSRQQFETPEGVPGLPVFLEVIKPTLDSLTLEWGPPSERNGILTGYTLKYQTSRPFLPAFGNVSSSVREDGAVVSWEYWGPDKNLYVEYIVENSKEDWKKELVNGSQSYLIKGLKAGMSYRVRVVAKDQSDVTVHSTEELLVTLPAMASRQVDIATQGWFIGLMCAIALLILVLLIKEDAHADPEIQPMKDDDGTFGEYSDTEDHKPLKGSRTPSNGTVKKDDSDDSLVDYGEGGDVQFNEDGSFIGQYSGRKERDTAEGNESSEAPSPVNAMNSFV
ncbi:hypothetical protein Z043_113180, partial [Scleropages formosus]